MKQGPIYIGGAERSGTSLLYVLLTSHPNINMTRRTNLWAYINGKFGDLGNAANFEHCLDALRHYNRIAVLNLDFDALWHKFYQGEPSYGRLFDLIGTQVAERKGKIRWGDKSLNSERYANSIFSAFPNAKMLHVIRDPRDRYASALKRWKVIRGGVGSGTAVWLESVHLARHNVRRYPNKYKIVRYETLITQPEKTLSEICSFIGEEYDPVMFSMQGEEDFRDVGGNSSYGARDPGQITTGSIGRFRRILSPSDITFMQILARPEMISYNYPLELTSLSLKKWLMFTSFELPLNFAKMYTWKLREKYLDHKGRDIPSYRIVPDHSMT